MRCSVLVLAVLVVVAWVSGGFDFVRLVCAWSDGGTFLARLLPEPVRSGGSLGDVVDWSRELWRDGGATAVLATVAIAVVAVVLAMAVGLAFAFLAARNVATPEPFVPGGRVPPVPTRLAWGVVGAASRTLQMLLRAVPDYVWAFLLLTALGAAAWPWPAVLALAIHNAGILGRLCGETVENTTPNAMAALRAAGATRRAIAVTAVLPACFPRFLLYFFYRFETCVRDATVLGMLGTASLGFRIDEAANRFAYDEVVFFVLLGAGVVLAADVVSSIVRKVVRVG